MFDLDKAKNGMQEAKESRNLSAKTLSGMNIHELLALKAQIDTFLPSQTLVDMDLEGELLMQYHQTKLLLSSVIDDEETPANQKAQLMNTCSAILTQITKSQSDLYNGERLKILEQALINALKTVDTDIAERFFVNYERELKTLDTR